MDPDGSHNDHPPSHHQYFYSNQPEADPYTGIIYPQQSQQQPQISQYVDVDLVQNVQPGTLPRSLSTSDLSEIQAMHIRSHPHSLSHQHGHSLPLNIDVQHYHQHQLYTPIHHQSQHSHPVHGHPGPSPSSIPSSPPPPSPVAYDPLQSPLQSSSSEHSLAHSHTLSHSHSHSLPHSQAYPFPPNTVGGGGPGSITPNTTPSSGAPSPSPTSSQSHSRSSSLVHRSSVHTGASHRYNPAPSPPEARARRNTNASLVSPVGDEYSYNSDGEDDLSHMGAPPLGVGIVPGMGMPMGHGTLESMSHNRKEATRRQRIEAEQRRRDELREGYARLKDVLPITNQKSSKVSLLERAVTHILNLTKLNEALQSRLTSQEQEISRLRSLNERISVPGLVGEGSVPIVASQPHPKSDEIVLEQPPQHHQGHMHGVSPKLEDVPHELGMMTVTAMEGGTPREVEPHEDYEPEEI